MGRWISVETRLPKKTGSYLVARQRTLSNSKRSRTDRWVEICSWGCALTDGELPWHDAWKEHHMGGSFEAGGVTHWMPLPQHPEEL